MIVDKELFELPPSDEFGVWEDADTPRSHPVLAVIVVAAVLWALVAGAAYGFVWWLS